MGFKDWLKKTFTWKEELKEIKVNEEIQSEYDKQEEEFNNKVKNFQKHIFEDSLLLIIQGTKNLFEFIVEAYSKDKLKKSEIEDLKESARNVLAMSSNLNLKEGWWIYGEKKISLSRLTEKDTKYLLKKTQEEIWNSDLLKPQKIIYYKLIIKSKKRFKKDNSIAMKKVKFVDYLGKYKEKK